MQAQTVEFSKFTNLRIRLNVSDPFVPAFRFVKDYTVIFEYRPRVGWIARGGCECFCGVPIPGSDRQVLLSPPTMDAIINQAIREEQQVFVETRDGEILTLEQAL